VQNVVDELSGEKIDIIFWSDDPEELICNVLSPSDVEDVVIEDEEAHIATAIVPDDQLSLAIGKQGQNVRLAARVSGWKIDIKSHSQYYAEYQENEIMDVTDSYEEEPEAIDSYEEAMDSYEEEPEVIDSLEEEPEEDQTDAEDVTEEAEVIPVEPEEE
jgi:N utilization substance protein A